MTLDRGRALAAHWVSGLVVAALLTGVVSAVIGLLEPRLPALSLLVLYMLVVLPVAITWGLHVAIFAVLLSVVVFSYLFLEPVRTLWIAETRDLVPMGVFLVTALVVAELAARMRRAVVESTRLSREQSALRRVATLVARSPEPVTVFEAVTREVGLLCDADLARMERYEEDGVVGVAVWSRVAAKLAVGTRIELDGPSIARAVLRTGAPARVDTFERATGRIADEAHELGIRSSVGCPIVVGGHVWGVIAASSRGDQPFPSETEAQITRFTELVATAVANAESSVEINRLAREQAALRRVATLVAAGAQPDDVFTSVTNEVTELLGSDTTIIVRFAPDGTPTHLGGNQNGAEPGLLRVLRDPETLANVTSGSSATVDSAVFCPITVEGRVWGAFGVRGDELPIGIEKRLLDFTELIATAIANAESHGQLIASRARVVAAADETRRRIERDLHDGAQQRLVSLALELRLAETTVPDEVPEVRTAVQAAASEITEVLDDLREISRGIHPAILSEGGLSPALRTLARRAPLPVEMRVSTGRRFPPSVEIASYYVVSEALTNTSKHSQADHVEVLVEERNGWLRLSVSDDGSGGADPSNGSGLVGLRDRVEALGGAIMVSSPAGKGTTIVVSLPVNQAG
jgi:signal transduction histidine kinase